MSIYRKSPSSRVTAGLCSCVLTVKQTTSRRLHCNSDPSPVKHLTLSSSIRSSTTSTAPCGEGRAGAVSQDRQPCRSTCATDGSRSQEGVSTDAAADAGGSVRHCVEPSDGTVGSRQRPHRPHRPATDRFTPGCAGFARRLRERNWRLVLPDLGLIEIPVLVANVLDQAHGIKQREPVDINVTGCAADVDLGGSNVLRRVRMRD